MIKAILSDFDGTLVDEKGYLDPSVKDLIQEIQKKGIRFSIATSRAHIGRVGDTIRDLGIDGYHIFNGGALILDTVSMKRLWYQPISEDSAKKVINYLKENNLVFVAESLDTGYEYNVTDIPEFMKGAIVRPLSALTTYSDLVKIMTLAFANSLSDEEVKKHTHAIGQLCKDITFIPFMYHGKGGFDITSEKSTKHTAVLEYMRMLNLKKRRSCCNR